MGAGRGRDAPPCPELRPRLEDSQTPANFELHWKPFGLPTILLNWSHAHLTPKSSLLDYGNAVAGRDTKQRQGLGE